MLSNELISHPGGFSNQPSSQTAAVNQSRESFLEKSFFVKKTEKIKKKEMKTDLVNKITLRLKNPKMQNRYQEYQQETTRDKILKLLFC